MEKIKEKIFYPVLSIIIATLIIAIVGQIIKDDWTTYYNYLPKWVWILGIIAFILVNFLTPLKFTKKNKKNNSVFVAVNNPIFGYQKHSKLRYKNVDWYARFPKRNSWDVDASRIDPEIIEIEEFPYCPNCDNIELDEKKSRFGKYKWKCIGCGFVAKNKLSAKDESKNALKLVKNEYIKNLKK